MLMMIMMRAAFFRWRREENRREWWGFGDVVPWIVVGDGGVLMSRPSDVYNRVSYILYKISCKSPSSSVSSAIPK